MSSPWITTHGLPYIYLNSNQKAPNDRNAASKPPVTHSLDVPLRDAVQPSIVIHVLFHGQQVIQGIFLRTVAKEGPVGLADVIQGPV